MTRTWKVAKIAGIDIFIDSSWLIIFILFSWTLAYSYYPQSYPDWPVAQNVVLGVLTSLSIFLSVLLHELAHSLVALGQGEQVKSITLFILGGVAQISGEPKKPWREFTMALVGPVSSLAIAICLFVLSFFLRPFSLPLSAAAGYVAVVNVALAVFNMLPGYPMDGGRVLRSLVWQITGDLRKATNVASKFGQGVAFLLIFLGVLQVLTGNYSGLWFLFVGWFLHGAAVKGYRNILVELALKGVRAEELMTTDFETVSSGMKVQDLVDDHILQKRERVFLVSDDEELKGIVCLEDVKAVPRKDWLRLTVAEVMTPRDKLESVSLDSDGQDVLQSLTRREVHQVPVMDGGRVAGIICRNDLLKYIQLKSELS